MKKRRDLIMAAAALLAVLIMLALGFHALGPRADRRAARADERRVEDLRSIAQAIYYRQKALPATLAELPVPAASLKDPVTGAPYEYHPDAGKTYELCATFASDSATDYEEFRPRPVFWSHPKGRHCFQLDASQMAPFY